MIDPNIDRLALEAAIALVCMIQNDPATALHALRRIPRDQRGELKIALDDLDMALSRLGNQ